MKLHPIDPKKLSADPITQYLWFRGEEGDLYIIFKEKELSYFEITIDTEHVEGGYQRPFRMGKFSTQNEEEDRTLGYKSSRLVEYYTEISEPLRKKCIELVYKSDTLERAMKEGLMEYLSSKGEKDSLLLSEFRYESFRDIPIEKENLLDILKKYSHVLKLLLLSSVILTASVYFVNFLKMDKSERLKELCKNGDVVACKKLTFSSLVKGDGATASDYATKAKVNETGLIMSVEQEKCKKGDLKACAFLATKTKNESEKIKLLKVACAEGGGDKDSCLKISKSMAPRLWEQTPQNYKNSQSYKYLQWASSEQNNHAQKLDSFYEKVNSCHQQDRENCKAVAEVFLKEGYFSGAIEFHKKACDLKEYSSCVRAGEISRRPEQMQEFFKIACANNDYKGCFLLKTMKSKNLAEKSVLKDMYSNCLNGNEQSCLNLKNGM